MERGSAAAFDRLGTIGIEEEFYVVDDDGRPAGATHELVYESSPPAILEGRLDHELFTFVIETQTPIIESPGKAGETLHAVRSALWDHARSHGYRIAAAGLHPSARWFDLEHVDKPRYRSQLDRIQYPQHRNTTAGLHVHVGVDDADKAVWVANELRWYVPVLLALAANSPFWCGTDTGLASARAKIFEALPNTGIPTAFADFAAFDRFERRMVETDSIQDRGELWFDVRPHTAHGTVEIRAPDGQRDPSVVLDLVAACRGLVLGLAEAYEDGASARSIRRELLDENKWRAMRYGHAASFIDETGSVVSLETVVDRAVDRFGVDSLHTLLERESGTSRQRRVHASDGMDALCQSLTLDRESRTHNS